jgi:cobalt/nickel transport system permease protein
MHIPDGFLSTPVWASLGILSASGVHLAARNASRSLPENRVPLLGVMGAFVFAAQMVNFQVGIGTSAHLVGASLLALTLGPAAAAVVMTAIVAVQALVFQDGGLLALGANVFNMALAGVAAGLLPSRLLGRNPAGIFLGGFLSVSLGAALALAELWLSGVHLPRAALNLSLGFFAIAAAAEGLITLFALRSIERISPQLSPTTSAAPRPIKLLAAAAVVLVIAGVLMASSSPDTLESFAQRAGFASAEHPLNNTPFAGYQAPWFTSAPGGQAFAGLLGLGLVFVLIAGTTRLLGRRR